jgi:hypothetical protein
VSDAVERIVRANPVPGDVVADDELVDSAALFSAIVSRRGAMADTGIDRQEPEDVVRTAWYRHPAFVMVAAAVAVVIVLGATPLLFRGSVAPTADPTPITPMPPTTEAAPATTEAPQAIASTTVAETITTVPEFASADLVSVERVAAEYLNAVLDGGRIWDVTLGGPGLVAVGEVSTPDDEDSVWGGPSRDAIVLVSSDGRDWERVDDPEVFGGDDWQQLERVWGSSTGLIAQGLDNWYASGDGTTWALITDNDLYNAWDRQYRYGDTWFEFHEGGPGWVAALYRDVGEFSWDCVDYASRRCESPELQEVLVSSDGLEWESTADSLEGLVEPPTAFPATPDPDEWNSGDSNYPWNLAWDQERAVAVRFHEDARVGISSDGGETWLRVDPERFAGEEQLSYRSYGGETGIWTIDVIRFDDMYVIVGDAYFAAGVWILEWIDEEGQ